MSELASARTGGSGVGRVLDGGRDAMRLSISGLEDVVGFGRGQGEGGGS